MTKCPQCGHENKDDFKYCGKCGSELNINTICPFCNSPNKIGSTFCINCGKVFNSDVIPQQIQEKNNYQQGTHTNSNKLDLKALFAGSISIPIIIFIFHLINSSLYYNYIITYDGNTVLTIISIVLSGIIGMIIFNKLNREKNRQINILFVSFLSIIMLLIISALIGGYGYYLSFIILLFIFIIIGAYIGDYIERNGKI